MNAIFPIPLTLIDFEEPLIVMVPEDAVNVPEAEKFPSIVNDEDELTEPEIAMLPKTIPVPFIDLEEPFIVIVPLPEECVNVPAPLVEKFPPTEILTLASRVTPEPVIAILLKFCEPLPLIVLLVPLIVIVLELPVNVPSAVQFPAIVCEEKLPSKVTPELIVKFPLTVNTPPAVFVPPPEKVILL